MSRQGGCSDDPSLVAQRSQTYLKSLDRDLQGIASNCAVNHGHQLWQTSDHSPSKEK